ncbi:MAG: hypothetical protein WCF96_09520 [Eubacteriales bacterium]
MSARKRNEQVDNSTNDNSNPFEPDMNLVTPEFNLTGLLNDWKTKHAESDKRKIGIAERITKAKIAISRIQNMIDGLELKGQQESGQAWVNFVVRPIVGEIQRVFPNASIDINTMLSGAVTVTVCKRGIDVAGKMKGLDTKSITLCPVEDGVAVRDYSEDTGEYPAGSIGAIAGLNHPLVNVPPDKAIQFIVDWLLK